VKAVPLVGRFGTRLRPLTDSVKKELLPLVDRPILDHTLDRLVRNGVQDVVMSSPNLEAVDVDDGALTGIEALVGRPGLVGVRVDRGLAAPGRRTSSGHQRRFAPWRICQACSASPANGGRVS
jgi:hypothetical protein